MTEPDLHDRAEQIVDNLSSDVDGLDVAETTEKLDTLVNEYSVPVDEAERSVHNTILDNAGVDESDVSGAENDLVPVNSVDTDGEWVDVKVRFEDEWDPRSDSIAQVGLVGDASGTNKFVAFKTSELPALEEGESYLLESVVVDEYEGDYSIKLNSRTEITHLDEDVEVGDNSVTVRGPIVDIQSGSGLIKRCPHDDCSYVLDSGRCAEHGDVDDFEFDLRIKAILDEQGETHQLIFDAEMTEAVADMSLEEARDIVTDTLEFEAIVNHIEREVAGQRFKVTGPEIGENLLVNSAEPDVNDDSEAAAEDALDRLAAVGN